MRFSLVFEVLGPWHGHGQGHGHGHSRGYVGDLDVQGYAGAGIASGHGRIINLVSAGE